MTQFPFGTEHMKAQSIGGTLVLNINQGLDVRVIHIIMAHHLLDDFSQTPIDLINEGTESQINGAGHVDGYGLRAFMRLFPTLIQGERDQNDNAEMKKNQPPPQTTRGRTGSDDFLQLPYQRHSLFKS